MGSAKKPASNRTTKEGIFAESLFRFPRRLAVISEGDSWFSYPLNRNVADFLEMMGDFTMLRLEKNGDEAREMLAPDGPQYRKLRTYFRRYSSKLQLLIFSGGGNDILGRKLSGLLHQKLPAMTWRACINDRALTTRLDEIAAAYELLLAARDELAPQCQIVAHCYDYFEPDGRPAELPFGIFKIGPWAKPVFDRLGITAIGDSRAIIAHLVDSFHGRLAALATPARRFHLIDTRGTLAPGSTNWADEIHPSGTGAQLLAEKWRPTLRALFPAHGF
jgi:lysophospholipase L1-like esterase